MDKTRLSIVRDSRNKDSPWACRWYEPTDPESGKRRRRCRSFPTKQEARTFAAELRLERPAARVSGGITLARHCEDWLKIIKPNIRPATFECYQRTVNRLVGHFGEGHKLAEITPQSAESFLAHLVKVKIERAGNALSVAAREQHKRNCKVIFNKAVEWGKLADNPFGKLRGAKIAPRRWHRLEPAEFLDLVEAAQDLQTKCLYALLYTAGLRRSEALSLQWDNIDFENGRVIITSRPGTGEQPPFVVKDNEARSIPLPPYTLNLLTTWQAQAPERVPFVLLSKQRFENIKAIWRRLRKRGLPWLNRYWQNNTTRSFRAHVKRAGIVLVGVLTIHTLRKNAGQNWADRLPMNVVKEFMGHSDIATTQEFYSQVDKHHERIAADGIQTMLADAEQKAGKKDVSRTYKPVLATEKR
jgi:integrase